MDESVPLVVPEVNPDALDTGRLGIISSPNCSTMQLVVALAPIYRAVGLREIIVSTYQSVSGTGRAALHELDDQTRAQLASGTAPKPAVYPHPIAFNVLPQVETFEGGEAGYTTEELKIMKETRRILGLDPEDHSVLPITATCARVPVHNCHSESIRVETVDPLTADACRELMRHAPGVRLVDDPFNGRYPLASEAAGQDDVFVGRIRQDLGRENCLNLWVVGDNLRKGAALNAVQIAEHLHSKGRLGRAHAIA